MIRILWLVAIALSFVGAAHATTPLETYIYARTPASAPYSSGLRVPVAPSGNPNTLQYIPANVLVTLSDPQTLTNKTINCVNNTCLNFPGGTGGGGGSPGGISGDLQTNNGAGGFGALTPGTGVAAALAINGTLAGSFMKTPALPTGTECVHMSNAGVVSTTGSDCIGTGTSSNGQLLFNSAGSIAGYTIGGAFTTAAGTLNIAAGGVSNTMLANSSVLLNSHTLALGGFLNLAFSDFSGTIAASQMVALTQNHVYQGNSSNQPVDVTLSNALDSAIGSTRGSLLERGASGWAIIIPGASSTVFTSNGAGADPSWQASGASVTGAGVQAGQLPQGYGDTNQTMASGHFDYFTNAAFTAARTWTLPDSATQGVGIIIIEDRQRTLSATNTLTIQRAGITDTIDGGTATAALKNPGSVLILGNNGAGKWTTLAANMIGTCAASANQFQTGIDSSGVCQFAQPSSSNLSDAANIAFLNVNQAWTKGQAVTPTVGGTQSAAGTFTPDFSLSNSVTLTFGAGNLTIANPTNVKVGQPYVIALTQDGTGGRTVTWGTNYKWASATAPTLSTAANAKDIISCWADTTTTINCTLSVKGAS